MSARAALFKHSQRLQAEVNSSQGRLSARESELSASREAERQLGVRLQQAQRTIAQLEDSLLAAKRSAAPRQPAALASPPGMLSPEGGFATGGGDACLSSLLGGGTAATDDDAPEAAESQVREESARESQMVQLVSQQRDRVRKEVERLAEEARALKEALRQQQATCRKLQADNLELYEQLRFVKATLYKEGAQASAPGGGSGAQGSIAQASQLEAGHNSLAEEATEARYRAVYEEQMNPFAAFKRKERLQRYAELNVAERLMLTFSSFFLQHKHARLFLFGYMVCLHLLIWASVYSHMLHHGVTPRGSLGCLKTRP